MSASVIALLMLVPAAGLAASGPACEDFLAAHKKPDQLEYVGCKQQPDLQGRPLQATYRVTGANAAAVERYLGKTFKVKKLRHTCCLWESVNNSYRDRQSRLFTISMETEETTVASRAKWRDIPYFHVTVNLYPEAP
jgi:hypothetical protein